MFHQEPKLGKKRKRKLQKPEAFFAWLLGIADRVAKEARRKQQRQPSTLHERSDPAAVAESVDPPGPEVTQAVTALPEACAKKDWPEAAKFWVGPIAEQAKQMLGGLQLVQLGRELGRGELPEDARATISGESRHVKVAEGDQVPRNGD